VGAGFLTPLAAPQIEGKPAQIASDTSELDKSEDKTERQETRFRRSDLVSERGHLMLNYLGLLITHLSDS
jgi:hypothetical protein